MTGRLGRSASSRSPGTSTTPALMASNGERARRASPRTAISPESGLRRPARHSNSASWPWPSSAATPRTSPSRRSKLTPLRTPSSVRSATASAGVELAGTRPARLRGRLRARHGLLDVLGRGPEHGFDDATAAGHSWVEPLDRHAVAQDRRAVADGDHLGQAVRDEQRRTPLLAVGAHDAEDALGQVGRQRGRELVEDQQLGIARQRDGEVEHAHGGQRQQRDLLGEVGRDAELIEPAPHGVDRCARQAQVLGDRQIGHQRGVLEDRRDADAPRRRRRGDPDRGAVKGDASVVGARRRRSAS